MVNFLGLLGPQGPMPLHITEYVYNRELNHDDPTLARFLDLFNHRMICLFYRAWAVNRQTVSYDRRQDDRFSAYIGSLIGIGRPAFSDRDALPDVAKLHYSGHLACQTRHAEGLRSILENYFGVATSIREFVGQWIDIPDVYKCRLGASPDNATIGSTAVVGSRIWDCQHKIRIIMGPMELASYERLLPGSTSFSQLKAWLSNYFGDEISWDLQLVLMAPEVPTVRLGQEGRLGRTAWIKSRPFEADVKDMIIQSDAA
jgi:type VI secretion system protein ImpH